MYVTSASVAGQWLWVSEIFPSDSEDERNLDFFKVTLEKCEQRPAIVDLEAVAVLPLLCGFREMSNSLISPFGRLSGSDSLLLLLLLLPQAVTVTCDFDFRELKHSCTIAQT